MADEIKPALSADEWETQTIDGAGATAEGVNVGDGFDSVTFSGEKRHALAALALHGQPFGFTEDDINVIHLLAKQHHPSCRCDYCRELKPKAESIMARIAALLPPPT